ncbi:MAG: Gfo/Idh/MocA family protein [Armatimonadota bacterium]
MAAANKPLKIGLIGGGGDAWNHLSGFVHSQRVASVTLCEADEATVARVRHRFGIVKSVTADYHDLLSDPEVAVVDVNLPPAEQRRPVIEALQAGKHVLCAAPLADTLEGAEAIVAAAGDAAGRLFCVLYQRFIPAHVRARQLLEEELIGLPVLGSVSAVISDQQPVQAEVFQSLDFLGHSLGEVEAVTAVWRGRDEGQHEAALLTLEIAGGVVAQVTVLGMPDVERPIVERKLLGSLGQMLIRDNPEDELPLVVIQQDGFLPIKLKNPPDVREYATIAALEHFLGCLVEDKPEAVPIAEALAAQKLLAAAEEAAREGRRVAL